MQIDNFGTDQDQKEFIEAEIGKIPTKTAVSDLIQSAALSLVDHYQCNQKRCNVIFYLLLAVTAIGECEEKS
jgi:hypothetical protein